MVLERDLKNKIPYERGLHLSQLDSFLNGGSLSRLREVIKDPNYQIEFRSDYFNIYYKGGNILKVQGARKFQFHFEIKYCANRTAVPPKYENKIRGILERADIDEAIANLGDFAYEMDAWWQDQPKKEREFQQYTTLHNRRDTKAVYIVDIEYAYTGFGRADMLAVKFNADTGKYKVYIIEYKQGNNAISSGLRIEDGVVVPTHQDGMFKAGIYKHYLDATGLLGVPRAAVFATVRNSINLRTVLGLAEFPHVGEVEFEDEIEMLFVLSDYRDRNVSDVLTRELAAVEIARANGGIKYRVIRKSGSDYAIEL